MKLAILLLLSVLTQVLAIGDVDYTHNGDVLHCIDIDLKENLCGKQIHTLGGRPIYAYEGLRYSETPDRFKRGKLITELTDGDATYIRDKCGQHANIHAGKIAAAGAEDCLYLNVYTPSSHADGDTLSKMPVMIFFHGGGFVWGDSSLYMPTRLLEEDVILVTVHYRLGALSFFTTGRDEAPGNLALYDQNLSMQWVRAYIYQFGGDPNKVTIFGQSAGSASVNYHLAFPYSKDLMKGVIAHSGSAIDVWSLDPYPIESSFALADFTPTCENVTMTVGDTRNPTAEELDQLYECMTMAPFEEIAIAADLLSGYDRRHGNMGFRAASPSIQSEDITDRFVTQDPILALQNGEFNTDVALMNGACGQEGSFVFGVMYSAYLYPTNKLNDSDYFQNQMIGDLLTAVGIDDGTGVLADSLKAQYFPDNPMETIDDVTPGAIDLTGAMFLKSGAKKTADLHSIHSDEGTYLYAFEYEGTSTMFNFLFWGSGEATPPFDHGVTHTDDLLYIFSLPTELNTEDRAVVDKMVTLWTNFAKFQNPTPEGPISSLSIPEWESYDLEDKSFMIMKQDFTISQDYETRYTLSSNTEITPALCPTYDPTYEELQDQRDAYLITMIVFIILFVASAGGNVYLYMKSKR